MAWEILNIIGACAFAASGAVVAMEAKYDIFGVYILGLVTSFGGGIIRNMLLGIPINDLWDKNSLLLTVLGIITLIMILPVLWNRYLREWSFFDAIGLAAFSVQGAFIAVSQGFPLPAVIVAAVLTGCGGGMLRDVLARKKPLVFQSEIYALWAIAGGLVIGLGWVSQPWELYGLSLLIVLCRLISVKYQWRLPRGRGLG